jgi:hypothetical protein
MSRYFTPREANDALPTLIPLAAEIVRIVADIQRRRPELWPSIRRSVGNGGSAELSRLYADFERLDSLVHRVQDIGVQIKDLTTGLMDFPALRGDREVLLCWRHGEESVEFWHDLEAGIAGRQPIDWE